MTNSRQNMCQFLFYMTNSRQNKCQFYSTWQTRGKICASFILHDKLAAKYVPVLFYMTNSRQNMCQFYSTWQTRGKICASFILRDELSVEFVPFLFLPLHSVHFHSWMQQDQPRFSVYSCGIYVEVGTALRIVQSSRISWLSLQHPLDPKNRYHSL